MRAAFLPEKDLDFAFRYHWRCQFVLVCALVPGYCVAMLRPGGCYLLSEALPDTIRWPLGLYVGASRIVCEKLLCLTLCPTCIMMRMGRSGHALFYDIGIMENGMYGRRHSGVHTVCRQLESSVFFLQAGRLSVLPAV